MLPVIKTRPVIKKRWYRLSALVLTAGLLVSCQEGIGIDSIMAKAEKPIPARLLQKMKAKGMKTSSPIMLRIYKTENIIEVWKQKTTGRYDLLESYEICKWSGKLGPKFKEGDRQAPEGFYNVGKSQMNPWSKYHLSFNIGYPNRYDRSHGRTGQHLMVHGACSSAGCYSMTDERVEEIYSMARDSIKGGQNTFQVQAYPFRMNVKNLAKHTSSPHFEFWKMLKEGSDHFELTKSPPKVNVCEKRYVFNRLADDEKMFSSRKECPQVTMPKRLLAAYTSLRNEEQVEFKKALKRKKLSGKLKGDVSNITLIARGSEILPPPTPDPASVPVPEASPVIAVAVVDGGQSANTPAVTSSGGNLNIEGLTPVANSSSAIIDPQSTNDGTASGTAVEGVEQAKTSIPLPSPAEREVIIEDTPKEKTSSWKLRKPSVSESNR